MELEKYKGLPEPVMEESKGIFMLCISFGTSPLYSCSEQKEKQKVMLV